MTYAPHPVTLTVDQMIPAAGQGAIGLEISSSAAALKNALFSLRHGPTWLAVHSEPAVARTLGGSCSTPLGGFAEFDATGTLTLRAVLGDAALGQMLDGPTGASTSTGAPIRHTASARVTDIEEAETLGLNVAEPLLESAGRRYLSAN